jgi:RNA polymerase sigma-70 factor, ECF subfamily
VSFIRIITLNRQDDAEEVFQRTCMVLWQKFSQFDGENFLAWSCQVARFEMLKFRDAERRVKVLDDETISHLASAAFSITMDPSDRRTALADCLKKLPSNDNDLIRRRYYDGLSVKEIGDRRGRSTHVVYRELSRIHGALSRCIERSIAGETS